MILRLEKRDKQDDIEVLITYPQKNRTIDRLVSLIKSVDIQVRCYSDDEAVFINASDIYYIESVDKKTIVCCENKNYHVKERLYQIHEKLENAGFVQINKYCILNINKLEKIKTLANSHLEAIISNGKSLYITRKYLTDIKRILQENN